MAAPDATAARRRALLVATTTYADERLGQLRAPAGDAQALGAVLEDPAIGGFEVELAVDQPRDAVSQAIERFFGEAKPSDLLLLYVSGHGILARNRLYFATTTTDMAYVGSPAIPEGFVADAMEGSRSRSIVLMLDCCHSGAFQSGLRPKAATEVHPEHRFQGRGRITLSASSKLEYAFEEQAVEAFAPSAPGSLFTRFLVDGLRTGAADLDGDGEISIDEVYDYICDRVKGHVASQTPRKSGEVRGDLVIQRSGRRGGVPIELRRALNSPDHGLRALVLGELARRAAASEEGATPAGGEGIREMLDDGHPAVAAAAPAALALVEGGPPAPEPLAETPPPA